MTDTTLVTIFAHRDSYRVRELAPGSVTATTVKAFHFYDDAEHFVDVHYEPSQMCTPEAFRAEVMRRKAGA